MLKISSDVDVYVVDLDGKKAAFFENQLSYFELDRISRFKDEKHRNRLIVARGLLRQFLSDKLGIHPKNVMIEYGKYGKPMLSRQAKVPYIHFNISHCENIAVFAFSDVREVGIDIEAVRELNEADDVASRMFSINEFESYCNLPAVNKSVGFFNCWTRKEAFVKAIGAGLNYPLDSFDVSITPGEPAKILSIRNEKDACRAWSLESIDVSPNYVASLASFI